MLAGDAATTAIASMEADGGAYNQADATGFIKINSLRMRIRSLMQANRKK